MQVMCTGLIGNFKCSPKFTSQQFTIGNVYNCEAHSYNPNVVEVINDIGHARTLLLDDLKHCCGHCCASCSHDTSFYFTFKIVESKG